MNHNDPKYVAVLLEEIRDQNKAVLEAVSDMQINVSKIPSIEAGVAELKQDVKVIKAAVTDVSVKQQGYEVRLTQIEAAS